MEPKLSALILLALFAVASCDSDSRPAADYLHSEEYDRGLTPKDASKKSSSSYGFDFYVRVFKSRFGNPDKCNHKYTQVYVDALFLFSKGDVTGYTKASANADQVQASVLKNGLEMVDKCWDKVSDLAGVKASDEENWMDKMVALGGDLSDAQLLAKAAGLDLVNGKFDVGQLVSATESVRTDTNYTSKTLDERLFGRVKRICEGLKELVGGRSMIYNLRRLLKPGAAASSSSVSPRFLKLNEYHRICLPLDGDRLSEKLRQNIRANM